MVKKVVAILFGILVLAVAGIAIVVSRYDFNHLKGPLADAVRHATGRELTVGGDVHLALGLNPALTVENIRLANAEWGSRPEMVRLGRLEVQVALIPLIRGAIEIERFILIEPDILVESDPRGRTNLDFKPAAVEKTTPVDSRAEKAPEAAALTALALKVLEIRNARVAYRDGSAGRTHHVMLKQVRAAMTDITSPLEFSASGQYADQDFTLDGRIGPLAAALDPAIEWPVALQAKAMNISVEIDGQIQDLINRRGIDVTVGIETSDLNQAAGLAGLSLSEPVAMTLSATLKDSGAEAYRFSGLDLKLGQSDLTGTIVVDLGPKRPRITADLASKLIDARVLRPTAQETPKRPTGAIGTRRLFSAKPLPLNGLKAVDGTVRLKIEQVRLPEELAASQLIATLTLTHGRLVVSPFAARMGDGTLDGDLTLTARGKTADLATRLSANQLDLGKLLKDLETTAALEGHIDADLDIKASGASVAALMAGLEGHARLAMKKGRIGKRWVDLLGGNIADSLLGLIRPTAQKDALSAINCCVVRLDAVNGLADTTVLLLDTPQIAVTGNGRIDLRTERLDISLKPTPKQGLSAGKFGTLSMSLSELSRPLKIGGTLTQPSLAIDPTQTALALAKTIGGVAVFGPVGIASALAGTGAPEGGKDPCQAAIHAAAIDRKIGAAPARAAPTRPDGAPAPGEGVSLEQAADTFIKGLFGN